MSHLHTTSSDTVPVSQRVVRNVAETTDTDPVELEPLYDTIDPEGLDALFEPISRGAQRDGGAVSFEYAGCTVTVRATGDVEAVPVREARTDPRAERSNDDRL